MLSYLQRNYAVIKMKNKKVKHYYIKDNIMWINTKYNILPYLEKIIIIILNLEPGKDNSDLISSLATWFNGIIKLKEFDKDDKDDKNINEINKHITTHPVNQYILDNIDSEKLKTNLQKYNILDTLLKNIIREIKKYDKTISSFENLEPNK